MNDTTLPADVGHDLADEDPKREIARKPTRHEVEEAVRTLIRWAGDRPEREGLLKTPSRVARAYEEFFCGYDMDPVAELRHTFEETDGYDEMVGVVRRWWNLKGCSISEAYQLDGRTYRCEKFWPEDPGTPLKILMRAAKVLKARE